MSPDWHAGFTAGYWIGIGAAVAIYLFLKGVSLMIDAANKRKPK